MASFDGSDYGLGATYTLTFDFNTQVDALKTIIKDMKAAGYGAAGTRAAVKAFIEELRTVDSSGKSIDDITKKFKELNKVLAKSGYAGLGSSVKAALDAQIDTKQLNIIRGTGRNIAEKEDALAKFPDGGVRGIPPIMRITRIVSAVRGLTSHILKGAEAIAKVNREVLLLSYNTQLAVREITAMGGALEAYGGTKGEAANFLRSHEVELAKMMVGQGTGGKFMEGARLWGVEYIPDDPKEQMRAIVRALSDPNRSNIEKIGIANTYGLSKEQVSQMSRGIEVYDKEIALQERFAQNADAMAKASDNYLRSQQHLQAAYKDMKDGVVAPLLDLASPMVEWLSGVTAWCKENPVGKYFIGPLVVAGKELADLAPKVVTFLGALRLAGLFKGGGGAGGNTWGTIVRNGTGAAGAVGSLAGVVGAVGSVGGAVMTGINGMILNDMNSNVSGIRDDNWVAKGNKAVLGRFLKEGFEKSGNGEMAAYILEMSNRFGQSANGATMRQHLMELTQIKLIETISLHTAQLVDFARGKEKAGKGEGGGESLAAKVTIEQIDILVNSDSADPAEVANAVHEQLLREMREVVVSLEAGGMV